MLQVVIDAYKAYPALYFWTAMFFLAIIISQAKE
jgi:hypothetical protein